MLISIEKDISKNIKGRIGSFELKIPGLGNHFLKIGATTTKGILDKYYSDLANASGWSGIGIVEGTALYLESIREEAMGQALLNAFNMFESVSVTEGDMINEAKSIKVGDVGYDYLDSTIEIVEVGNFKKISKSFKKETGDDPSDYGYEETQKGDYYLGKILDSEEGNVGDFAIYPVKYDHSTYWGLSEGTVTEAEVNSDEEFVEYANTVLQKAFGEDFDEAKAKKVIDGILSKADGDYGTAVGMLTSSLGQ